MSSGIVQQLREENARLRALLNEHGISCGEAVSPWPGLPSSDPPTDVRMTAAEKVALFRRLFRGRVDVYPRRWESSKGKAGYAPACKNEWVSGICRKPKVKCGECPQRSLLPVTDQVVYDHLAGFTGKLKTEQATAVKEML